LPAWSPKYTVTPCTIGEDSVPAPTGRDQTIRPVFIDSAANRPLPGEWPLCESAGISTSPAWGAMAGDAAHSVPILWNHFTWPLLRSIARAAQSSSRTNIVSW
jgi:hypothetical protein